MQALLAQCNHERLRDFVDELAATVGTDALDSSLGVAMTDSTGGALVGGVAVNDEEGNAGVGVRVAMTDIEGGGVEEQHTEQHGAVLDARAAAQQHGGGHDTTAAAHTGNESERERMYPLQGCVPATALRTAVPTTDAPCIDSATTVALAVACSLAASGGARPMCAAFPWPLYLIATRDSFAVELVQLRDEVCFVMAPCFFG